MFYEETLARLLHLPIDEVFDKVLPMPDSPYKMADRINKKKALGLDASVEESIHKFRRIEKQLSKIMDEIKTEPKIMPEQLDKLAGLAKELMGELHNAYAAATASVGN